ncbi:MAG: amino acid adenylation domain-containing protein, partial [Gemmatimonadota bacterium]
MSEAPERLAHLSPAKRLLLLKMRREQAEADPQRIPRRAPGAPAPLSFAQQRLWFLHRLDPGSAAYNLPYPLRLRGPLDVRALERSLTALAERHETLRTVFPERAGEPAQAILPAAPRRVPVADLRGLREAGREGELRRLVADEARRPFDLAAGPLLRVLLARAGDEEWGLCFTMHHVVSDGWSMGVLVNEVNELYGAYSRGEEPRLPELPVQYADYAAWQRERLSGEALEAQLGWWRERLSGAPPLLELPADFPRRPDGSAPGGEHPVAVPAATLRSLRELAREEGATVFMVLLAAWQCLLARWSGQDDVSVGTPIAGRTRKELEGLIGFFVNTLVLRTDLSDGLTFRGLLARVRETTLGAYAHQELPFERLVEELAPERSLAHNPLFQVTFALLNTGRGELRLGGLGVEPLAGGEATAPFDLSLDLREGPEGIGGALGYRADLFEDATVGRMAAHFVRLLDGVAAGPDRRVGELELLAPAERRQLLEEWSAAPSRVPRGRCVHELFAEQARRTPGAVALVHRGGRTTYAELDRASDRLARDLVGRGVGPEVRVGICAERSPEMVAGMLAVLKAGGAYLPLDPDYPAERLAFMLSDAAAPVLLAHGHLSGLFPGYRGETVPLDGAAEPGGGESGGPLPAVSPESLAYVIYTSGSTGTPKGTEVPHRAVPGFFWDADYARFDAEQTLLQHSSLSWDALTLELWPALLTGGRCVLLPARASEPALLAEQVREHGVTTLWLTAAYFNLVVDTLPEALAGVAQVMTGGEAVSPPHARRALELYPGLRLVNGYGPSECTVFASCWPVPAGFRGAALPIGRPVGDRRVYLLDRGFEPVPVGVPGELCIGGPAVARGYLGRPGLTAEKFVPDPFSPEPRSGARLYRTGDRARWRADGVLELVGRMDFQVKVRGFRVEPGEVEAVLASHPRVRAALVLANRDGAGVARLVAYALSDAEPGELRDFLRARLPEYMVPAAVVPLEAFPLTAHGKTDRRALLALAEPGSAAAYVAPRTAAEERMAAIWAEVLGTGRVGVHDDFFALGGHSLLAMRIVSRAREALGVEVPVRALFEAPTVAGLAERVAGAAPEDARPIPRRAGGGPAPLSFAQQRLWFIHRLEPESPAYNMPFPLRLRGRLDAAALRRALAEIVRRHETLRTTFVAEEGEPVQRVRPAGPVRLPLADLSGLPPERAEAEALRLAREEALRPFDLERGPLLRAALLRLDGAEHAALFTLHHVVGDGWSMEVLVRELAALYAAFSRGEPSPLPELPVQYADFAVWQRAQLAGETLESQLRWWRERLAGAPPLLELPTDRPRSSAAGARGAHRPLVLPPGTVRALRGVAGREGATMFMTLLAAWQCLLARWSGQDDVVVGTPIAGRTRRELEPLIGFFVNTLVLRADLSGDPSFRALLGRVRDGVLGAFAHQELPFERLVEELAPERSLAHTPLFQALFAYRSAAGAGGALRLPDLELAPLAGGGAEVAKFDLDLTLEEAGEELAGGLAYRAELFEAATAERMLGHFRALVEAVAAHPERPVSAVELLTEAERGQLARWNDTARGYPGGRVHDLFAAQAARTPDAVAVSWRGGRTSYAELDRRSARLANALRRRGVGPESRVGVCMARTPELLVALLGVLRAGGAYVPLDPAYPAGRLGHMLEDAAIGLVLTEPELAGRLPAGAARLLVPERERDGLAREPDRAPESGVLPENLSHVIFTSGSTGRPKGVMIGHASVVVLLHWLRENVGDEERSSTLFSTSVSFDVSVAEVFGTLSWGGTLVLVENALELPSAAEPVVHACMVPTVAAELLRTGGIPASVRTLDLAGEPLPAGLARALYGLGHVERVRNLYGPTEDTTYSTCSPVERGAERVLVGRPLADARAYVLDGRLRPAPVGVPGELYLAGAGLARGYAARPELTAERFLPDPHAEAGGRMYRTGDRARWLATGELEYLGRVDQQVKIRGFRIETGEVEAVLRAHPGVREAAVAAGDDPSGGRRLVGWVVPRGANAPDAAELRRWLAGSLPDYMVPSAFVPLERLPLTPSGKLDRRALPAPGTAAAGAEGYVAPRTPTGEVLAGIWAEALRVERVGAHDDFFELGGHSLLATRVVSQAREKLGVELPLRAVFEARTVAELAERVEALLREGAGAQAPPLLPVPRDGAERVPLSFAQQRLWFIDQLQPGSAAYNVPAALRLRGALDARTLRRA